MRSSSSAGGKASFGKLAVPKLGLMGIGRSNAAAASPPAAAETAPAAAPHMALHAARPHSRVHFSTPPPEDVDSDSGSSSDGGMEGTGTGNSPAAAAPPSAPAPSWSAGFDVPSGFTFTGDLEDDLDRLEALEAQQSDAGSDSDGLDTEGAGEGCGHGVGSGSESASPTIPALRSSPFQSRLSPVPPLLAGSLHKAAFSHLEASQAATFGGGGGTPHTGGTVPRLDLGGSSLHSNLEGRNASAQMQVKTALVVCAATAMPPERLPFVLLLSCVPLRCSCPADPDHAVCACVN